MFCSSPNKIFLEKKKTKKPFKLLKPCLPGREYFLLNTTTVTSKSSYRLTSLHHSSRPLLRQSLVSGQS